MPLESPTMPQKRFSTLKRGRSQLKRSKLKKRAKAKSQGWWQAKCDDLMQDIHKLMFDKCMVCGSKNEVGHHFITKSLSSNLRYEFKNLIPLCNSCHFRHHIKDDPYISSKIISVMGNDWYEWIENNRRVPIKRGVTELKTIHEEFRKIIAEYVSRNDLPFSVDEIRKII